MLKNIDTAVKTTATRPKGVLMKYRELLLSANNDVDTLSELCPQEHR